MAVIEKVFFQIFLFFRFFAKLIIPRSLYENLKAKWGMALRNFSFYRGYPPRALGIRLWGGFSQSAQKDLYALKSSSAASASLKTDAAMHLAKWHAFNSDYSLVLENLHGSKHLSAGQVLSSTIIETETLMRVNRDKDAQSVLQKYIQKNKLTGDLCLMASNVLINDQKPTSESERLAWINRIFHSKNLVGIKKINEEEPLGFFNFTHEPITDTVKVDGPKISIIMPAYNAQETIKTAIQSVLDQTWKNIELLVVDDCSSDATFEIVSEIAKTDPRLIPIKQKVNQGAYGARNTGLAQATGDYITVNDSDDWSHPQKIEHQITSILEDPSIIGTITKLVRVSEKLYFNNSWRLSKELIRENTSAIMIPHFFFNVFGGWNMVRSSGDSELYERFKKIFGKDAIAFIAPKIPFSFCLDLDTNLTKRSDSHIRTLYFGARNDYREAATWWHKKTIAPNLTMDTSGNQLPFPVPEKMMITPTNERVYDVVLIADFSIDNKFTGYVFNLISLLLKQKKRIAVFYYPNYKNLDRTRSLLHSEIYKFLSNREIDRLSIGDVVTSKWVMICDPKLLHHRIDRVPTINFDKLFVIVDDLSNTHTIFDQRNFDSGLIINNIKELFGVEGTWIGTSTSIKNKLLADPQFPKPKESLLRPFIELNPLFDNNLKKYTSDQGTRQPSIGCVGFWSLDDWFLEKKELINALCANQECKTAIYDQAKSSRTLISTPPENWNFVPPAKMNINQFIQNLDFYIYYPNEIDRSPEFDKVLLALASGIIVICSPEYQRVFSEAAVFATPEEVWSKVKFYWNDKNAYALQEKKGREFVKSYCDPQKIISVFEELD